MRIRGGTKRNPDRRTDGGRLAAVARMMGTPLIPWQRYVADVACEIDPDTGSFYYDTVVVSTPRQCGKSALVDGSDTYNASLGRRRRIAYAAQTGKDAEDHFKEYAEAMKASRLVQKVDKFRFSNGNMSVTFGNGSTISPMAMTKIAGHGKQFDKVTIDEAFSLTKDAGDTIMDAIVPTMNTRLKRTGITAQRWITSTEGTAESTYFNTLWYKPQLYDFREGFGDNVAGWARAFGNRRDEGITDRVIDEATWTATAVAPIEPDALGDRTVVFGVAVDVDATHTSISAGILNPDGTITTQLIETLDGTGYAPTELTRLCAAYGAPVVIDSRGTAADLADRLHHMTDHNGDPSLSFVDMDAGDYLTTGQSYVSGLANKAIWHAADPDLDASAANSARKWAGDAWRVSRRGSTGLTSPLESCMLAAWGAAHRPEESGPLQIF